MLKKHAGPSAFRAVLPELLLLAAAALMFGLALSAPLAFAEEAELSHEETLLWDAYLRGEVIRLHVLADNDSGEAQRVKLAVRDAILSDFGQQLAKAGAQDADTVYTMLKENTERMREVAELCARDNGFNGPVAAEAGVLTLPEKRYGQVTLPEGEYRGLRVTLGSGTGKNWWCVLFPSLCLAAASDEPWQSAAPEAEAGSVTWNCERIFRCWPACGG